MREVSAEIPGYTAQLPHVYNQPTILVVRKLRNCSMLLCSSLFSFGFVVVCFFQTELMRIKLYLGLLFSMLGELMNYHRMCIHMGLSPRKL